MLVVAAVLTALGLGGCAGTGTPKVASPGPARDQRARAQRFDPYPEKESGPELVGSRPREYDRPLAEPVRSQFERWSYGRSQTGP
jgi:hypothetical protein